MQISCAVTAQLISALFSIRSIVQSLFFLNPKFQAWLHIPVCVGPGRKPRKQIFSRCGSFYNICCCFYVPLVGWPTYSHGKQPRSCMDSSCISGKVRMAVEIFYSQICNIIAIDNCKIIFFHLSQFNCEDRAWSRARSRV